VNDVFGIRIRLEPKLMGFPFFPCRDTVYHLMQSPDVVIRKSQLLRYLKESVRQDVILLVT
jgi:hypothetical protein